MPICPKCRNIIPIGMARCDVCNTEISSIQPQSQEVGQIIQQQQQQPQPAQPMRHAGLILRGCAYIIDALIIVIPISIVWLIFIFEKYKNEFLDMTETTNGTPFSPGAIASMTVDSMILSGVIAIVGLLYFTVLEGRWQATIGKKVCHIYVIKGSGMPIDDNTAFIRNLFRLLWSIPLYGGTLFVIIDIILVLLKCQRIGDILAKTYVVRR